MREEEAQKKLHDIILSVISTNSFSESLLFLRKKKPGYIEIIKQGAFPITMTASVLEGDFCDPLNLKSGDQRIKFIDLASKMNVDILKKASKTVVIDKLNAVWQKNGINLTVQENNFQEILESIERIILLEKSKLVIRVCECLEEFLEILPYCKRYTNMTDRELATEVGDLVDAYTDLKVLIIVEKDAKERAVEALTKAGHPKDMLAGRTAGTLMTTIERMVTAGNAVMKCRKINPKVSPSKGQLIDQIANYWFEEEALSMQNTTDYIIPLPE